MSVYMTMHSIRAIPLLAGIPGMWLMGASPTSRIWQDSKQLSASWFGLEARVGKHDTLKAGVAGVPAQQY